MEYVDSISKRQRVLDNNRHDTIDAPTAATGDHGDNPMRAQSDRASACLIAAAPDLLEALTDLVAWDTAEDYDDVPDVRRTYGSVVAAAKAAIEKARVSKA